MTTYRIIKNGTWYLADFVSALSTSWSDDINMAMAYSNTHSAENAFRILYHKNPKIEILKVRRTTEIIK